LLGRASRAGCQGRVGGVEALEQTDQGYGDVEQEPPWGERNRCDPGPIQMQRKKALNKRSMVTFSVGFSLA